MFYHGLSFITICYLLFLFTIYYLLFMIHWICIITHYLRQLSLCIVHSLLSSIVYDVLCEIVYLLRIVNYQLTVSLFDYYCLRSGVIIYLSYNHLFVYYNHLFVYMLHLLLLTAYYSSFMICYLSFIVFIIWYLLFTID